MLAVLVLPHSTRNIFFISGERNQRLFILLLAAQSSPDVDVADVDSTPLGM